MLEKHDRSAYRRCRFWQKKIIFQMELILILAGMLTSKIVAFRAQKTRTHILKNRRILTLYIQQTSHFLIGGFKDHRKFKKEIHFWFNRNINVFCLKIKLCCFSLFYFVRNTEVAVAQQVVCQLIILIIITSLLRRFSFSRFVAKTLRVNKIAMQNL